MNIMSKIQDKGSLFNMSTVKQIKSYKLCHTLTLKVVFFTYHQNQITCEYLIFNLRTE